jgi:hypothetical protein
MASEDLDEDERLAIAEEERFEREIQEILDLEVWETRAALIPDKLKQPLSALLLPYSTMQRIAIYKFLALFEWSEKDCQAMHDLLILTPADKVDWLTDKLNLYREQGHLNFTFKFFCMFEEKVLREIYYVLPADLLDRAINMGRFLEPTDLDIFAYFINELGVKETLFTISECDEPFVKHCRLCRSRRVFNLENRLLQDQVPRGMIRVTGALAIYDKSEVWSRADEMLFKFDHAKGAVFFNGAAVDMMRICSKCLDDVLRAATTDCTDVAIHHLLAEERKPMLAELRRREQLVGDLVVNMAHERVRRRVRDFGIKSLETQRRGLRLEREAEEARVVARLKEAKRLADEEQYRVTMAGAMAVDQKWVDETLRAENKVLGKKVHLASMNYHPGFTAETPASTRREHPHSWKPAHFELDGTPVSAEGALARYRTAYKIKPDERLEELQDWKAQMLVNHEQHERRVAELAARRREADLKELADQREYVDKRIKRLKRKEENTARILEIEEQARIDKRAADKQARMLLRVAKMEANERFLMEIDDDLSLKRRFYEFELWREDVERENMWYEEAEQCGVDRFWGLDHEAALKQAEREKWVAWYDARVQKTRDKLIMSKQIRPFKIEAKLKMYIDPRTGEVIK